MKATELRIGNWVHHNTNWSTRNGDKKKFDYQFEERDWYFDAECLLSIENDLQPIPLTEEWLVKFGFEKLTSKSDGFIVDSYSYTRGVSFIVHFDGERLSTNFWQGNEKKYVHQLQNLYFALTGQELIAAK
tara:strand:- start:610 stop:1002 length:393 start_codon:yes stop_codon:yes gene_type:complete